jgi:hypothetical protein
MGRILQSAGIDRNAAIVCGLDSLHQQGERFLAFQECTIHTAGLFPKYLVCNKGPQFWCAGFKISCEHRKIRPRSRRPHWARSTAAAIRLVATRVSNRGHIGRAAHLVPSPACPSVVAPTQRLELQVEYDSGRKHLPIVSLRRAA